jgi:hypothetical protein
MQGCPPLEPESAPQGSPHSHIPSPTNSIPLNPCPALPPALPLSFEETSSRSVAPVKAPSASISPLPSRDPPFPPQSKEISVCIDVLVPAAHEIGPPETAPLQSPPPLRHSSKTTPHIVDEICAVLPVDIEDLPTTLPFHTTDAKHLTPSTQDTVTVERLIINTGAGTSEKAVELRFSERTVEQMVFAEASTSEKEVELWRRQRLVERRKGRMAVTGLCSLECCEMQVGFCANLMGYGCEIITTKTNNLS